MLSVGSVNSVSHAMYSKLNEKIERISNMMYLFIIKLTVPCVIIPGLLITMTNHFIYDLGVDSYYLPILLM